MRTISPSFKEKRDKRLVYVISFIILGMFVFLYAMRIFYFGLPLRPTTPLTLLILSLPIVINYLGGLKMGRIAISWVPVIAMYYNNLQLFFAADSISLDAYNSFKIYLLIFSVVPFSVLDSEDKAQFLLGISLPLIATLFNDPIMTLINVGPDAVKEDRSLIVLNSFRFIFGYLTLSSCALALRLIVDKSDALNQKLFAELEEKNKIIKEQAESEVHQLNQQLFANLDELAKREFILSKAQEIAKVGSWEYDSKSQHLYWSDQMYSIFETEKDFDLSNMQSVKELIFQSAESNAVIEKSAHDMIEEGIPIDITIAIKTSSGVSKWLRILGFPTLQNEVMVGASGIVHDITYFKTTEEELNKAQANLKATINNTELLIWSVDRDFNLLMFNEPFEKYILELYGVNVKVGQRVLQSDSGFENDAISKKWNERYLRALTGEIVVLEESNKGVDLKLSLSPIIENGNIIGVSSFADNITERNKRNRELAEANKKISELKVMALRSVMNPHFVFNVLNSIQFFIAKNDRLNAINYLSTFSKLIRTVLNHSVAEKIKLTEELDMLKNYIELEKVRFEGKFDYQFEVDASVEVDTISIPSLLIQPYIENAILHGINNKIGKGHLIIRVKSDDDHLQFEIEDDGIGREAAAMIKAKNQSAHKSVGSKLTEERLRMFNEQSHSGVSFEDLKNGDEVLGTRVTIKVKI